jgi:integrase
MTRLHIPNRLRFEIFKRDAFKCVYCGNGPPDFRLHLEHKIAIANGGTNASENLVTACHNCNLGKSDILLDEPCPVLLTKSGLLPTNGNRLPREHFNHRGKRWRMFKRRPLTIAEIANHLPGPPWQLHFEENHRRHPWSLKFADKKSAIAEAKLKLDLHFAGREAELRASMSRPDRAACSTFAELLPIVNSLTITAGPKARGGYLWGARYVLRLALGAELETLSLAVLTADTGKKFFARATTECAKIAGQTEQNKFARNVAGAWSACCALFSPAAVSSMHDLGLTVPASVADFRRAGKVKQWSAPAAEYSPPLPGVLRATFRAWLELGRTPGYSVIGGAGNSRRKTEPAPLNEIARRNMFIAAALMLACGLRKSEVTQIRWRHFTLDELGNPRLIAKNVKVKNHSGKISVRPLDPFWRLMHRVIDRNGWAGQPDDLVLTARARAPQALGGLRYVVGGHCDATYWPFYHIGKWLRSLGWNLQKTNHALRDCACSYVTMKWGLERAKLFARHKHLATTESHYGRFVREEIMDNPRALNWLNWAKI